MREFFKNQSGDEKMLLNAFILGVVTGLVCWMIFRY